MFVLFLNDMRFANVENLTAVGRAETKEQLKDFISSEVVEPYKDDRWGKNFRQGGPLEWFNPPWNHDEHLHFRDVGTLESWIVDTTNQFNEKVLSLPAF